LKKPTERSEDELTAKPEFTRRVRSSQCNFARLTNTSDGFKCRCASESSSSIGVKHETGVDKEGDPGNRREEVGLEETTFNVMLPAAAGTAFADAAAQNEAAQNDDEEDDETQATMTTKLKMILTKLRMLTVPS
jgi:hypothetical protein